MDYWTECVSIAFEEAGIVATSEQIAEVASAVEGAHENYGMAFGHDCIPNPQTAENAELKKQLAREKNKTICAYCGGKGRLVSYGPVHSSDSECYKCHGSGFIY